MTMPRPQLTLLLTAMLALPAAARQEASAPAGEEGAEQLVPGPAPELPPAPARVVGSVRYAGATPLRLKTFSNDVDVEACGDRVSSRAVQAGRRGLLADALVEVRTPDGTLVPGARIEAASRPLEVALSRCSFEPTLLVVPAGSRVEILNPDGILHELRGLSLRNEPIAERLPRFRRRLVLGPEHFHRPERLRVSCERHSWSRGWWVTTDNGFRAVTGEDGRFVVDGLPAGTYLVTAWHGEFGVAEKEAVLAAGEELELDFEFR